MVASRDSPDHTAPYALRDAGRSSFGTREEASGNMKVILASPHGFCAGVVMAIETLDRALDLLGAPIYVYHEIVHNKNVVERFGRRGVVFVDSLEDVPEGSNVLF